MWLHSYFCSDAINYVITKGTILTTKSSLTESNYTVVVTRQSKHMHKTLS